MASIFTKIIRGEIPSYKVAENDKFYAFLDISPLQKGHTLVVPKQEIDYFFDIEDDLMKDYICFAKKIAVAIKKAYPCEKVGMTVIGLEVRHSHIHLVPMHKEGDLNFANEKLSFTEDEFKEIASNIAKNL
ncbi:MAG: HIT family protein [Bacteroidales bacterium]|jgi:histidine triad (HIT) family protein|nr:HIT family protein [Bacteroidales bacterium]MDY6393492.1 HIT family protein [Bacteroidales bacterium]MEE3412386.1 HIT family protein [Bacteroidales bacterium]